MTRIHATGASRRPQPSTRTVFSSQRDGCGENSVDASPIRHPGRRQTHAGRRPGLLRLRRAVRNLQKLRMLCIRNPLPIVPQYGLGDSKIVWTKGKHFHSGVSWLAVSCEVVVAPLTSCSILHQDLKPQESPGIPRNPTGIPRNRSWGFLGIPGDSLGFLGIPIPGDS